MDIRFTFYIIILIVTCFGNKQIFAQQKYLIHANAPGQSYKMAYLSYQGSNGNIVDSVKIKNGKLLFKGKVKEPILALIKLTGDQKTIKYSFYLDNENYVSRKGESFEKVINNSKINKLHQEYIKLLFPADSVLRSVDIKWTEGGPIKRKEEAFFNELQAIRKPALELKKKLNLEYISNNPNSYFSIIALEDALGKKPDYILFDEYYKKISQQQQESIAAKNLKTRIESYKNTSIGAKAIEFTLPDTSGTLISLSDFRGKYVLIDFWASWCGPCRKENPNLVNAYNNFSNNGFTILGISLDNPGKHKEWVQAIETDGLKWTQLSDLMGWKSEVAKMYLINSIPQNYLIDPNGNIIAKNLKGEHLNIFLQQLFKQ